MVAGCTQPRSQAVPSPGVAKPVGFDAANPVVRFRDITKDAGVLFTQSHGGCGLYYFVEQVAAGAALFDANGDGFLDIYFPQPKPLGKCIPKYKTPLRQRLYLNDGKGRFQLAAKAFGNSETDYGIAVGTGDYDNDGDVDLFVACQGRSTLYRNKGDGTFEDVTAKAGANVRGMATGAVWFDYDDDGFLDLYVARYCEWSVQPDLACLRSDGKRDVCTPTLYRPSSHVFFRNNGNGTFTEVTKKLGMDKLRRRGLGVAAADFNGDGRLDLFVANDMMPNFLYINRGGGRMQEMGMQVNVAYGLTGEALANMGVAVGDYNDDLKLDALVTTFSNQPYTLYRNDGSEFADVSGTTGIHKATLPYLAFGTGFVDAANRGFLDLFCANGHVSPYINKEHPEQTYKQRNQLLLNNGKGHFTDDLKALPKDDVRVHRGAAFGDIDNDGRVDILATALGDRPTLLHNESKAGNWLILKLTNKQGCVTPIGTRCVATIGGKKRARVVLGGGSYASESDHRVHFGLGDAAEVEQLEIQWLSGRKQVLKNVKANQILAVQEEKTGSTS